MLKVIFTKYKSNRVIPENPTREPIFLYRFNSTRITARKFIVIDFKTH